MSAIETVINAMAISDMRLRINTVAGNGSRAVSLKNWLKDGASIITHQVTVKDDKVTNYWNPGARTVDKRATGVYFDNSYREFAGVTHIAHDDETYIAWDKSMGDVLIYMVA